MEFVDYREAPKVQLPLYVHFGDWEQILAENAEIAIAAAADEFAGSYSVKGIESAHMSAHKRNILEFDNRSFIIHPHGMDIGPVSLAFIRQKLAQGAIATTTGVTILGDRSPSGYFSVGDLFPTDWNSADEQQR